MRDYSAKSDIEINALVSEELYGPVSRGHQMELANGTVDYCNNPSDAWPIIVENKIDIIQDNGQDCPLASDSILILMRDNSGIFHQDINPLRAAMIVFLMMKDAEKGHG